MNSLLYILIVPAIIAILGLFPKTNKWLPSASAVMMGIQLPIVLLICLPVFEGKTIGQGSFVMDGIGAAFTIITTIIASAAMIQASFTLPLERKADEHEMSDKHFCFFYTLVGLFLSAMYAVPLTQHLGYMWILIEATTLMSAPLIDYHRSKSSLEATWKYLILCSVGIAFALFGTLLIFASQHNIAGGGSMVIGQIAGYANGLDPGLLRLGFVFCLLGYGTKSGIFPLHNWLPDAHSEAPSSVSAMLSGALLNCALVAIWRLSQLVSTAGQTELVHKLLVPAGAITVIAASLMLVSQHDLKRMLAYSSVEHVGLLTIAIGIGSGQLFVLHAFNHSIVKAALFLLAGNLLYALGTKSINKLGGLLKSKPVWGILLAAAAFAIAGSPPFGTFISEWLLLKNIFSAGETLAAVSVILGLTITFIAISAHVGRIILGKKQEAARSVPTLKWSVVPMILIAASFIAGIIINPSIMNMLNNLAKR